MIEACKCVTYTLTGFEHHWSRLSHFLIRKKGVILSQNKWFNNSKTAQLPVALPPPLPCTRWETQLHWNNLRRGKESSTFFLSHISILRSWQVCGCFQVHKVLSRRSTYNVMFNLLSYYILFLQYIMELSLLLYADAWMLSALFCSLFHFKIITLLKVFYNFTKFLHNFM